MFDINKMKQMQAEMQAGLEKVQAELAEKQVEGTAGGGAVTVVCSGKQEILSVKIKEGVVDVDAEELEMLQDLFIAAANQAIMKAKELNEEGMASVTGGLKIPGMM